jgi:hypothetical protein
MTLARALHAESLKLKRTIALKMVVLAPLTVIVLTLFMASQAPFSTVRRLSPTDHWTALVRVNLQFWGLLMLPLYFTLQTALIAGLDHSDNQWKALFSRPVPRWTVYIGKLLFLVAMTATSTAVLAAGMLLEGMLLRSVAPELRLAFPGPVGMIVQRTAAMTALAFLPLTVQHWVSLRWRSFSIAVGVGVIAIVTSFGMLLSAGPYGAWPEYFPWSLPMLVLARHPVNLHLTVWSATAAGVAVAVLGCINFCRREIT